MNCQYPNCIEGVDITLTGERGAALRLCLDHYIAMSQPSGAQPIVIVDADAAWFDEYDDDIDGGFVTAGGQAK